MYYIIIMHNKKNIYKKVYIIIFIELCIVVYKTSIVIHRTI